MGRTACTEPQCLYKGALYLLIIDTEHAILSQDYFKGHILHGSQAFAGFKL